MSKYKVAGYVKNALLWKNRNPEEMIAYNRAYFEKQLDGLDDVEFIDVYVDVTGHKETYKRPEMVRLIKDVIDGRVNLIYSRTSGYIAANAHELCMLLQFLYEHNMPFDLYTEDPEYQFNTLQNPENQVEELRRMAKAYCTAYTDAYEEWKVRLLEQMNRLS